MFGMRSSRSGTTAVRHHIDDRVTVEHAKFDETSCVQLLETGKGAKIYIVFTVQAFLVTALIEDAPVAFQGLNSLEGALTILVRDLKGSSTSNSTHEPGISIN